MGCKIEITGENSPGFIMEKDRDFLDALSFQEDPIIHLYRFSPRSATYGHFLRLEEFFDLSQVKKESVLFGRRPTGGGVIFHMWDLAFSVLVPSSHKCFSDNTLVNYQMINRPVLLAVEAFLQKNGCELIKEDGAFLGGGCQNFCMAKPTKYDVMLEGKKVAGAAQRKTKNGFLHQGSISLTLPDFSFLESILLPGQGVLEGMRAFTYPLLGNRPQKREFIEGQLELEKILLDKLREELS